MAVRIMYGLFCLLLLASAAAQYNDPDGLTWIILYGGSAVLFGYGIFGKYYPDFTLGLALVTGFAALLYLPDFITFATNDDGVDWSDGMANTYPYIERMREFGGLLLTAGFLFILYFVGDGRKNVLPEGS